jgi:hypothetical protein
MHISKDQCRAARDYLEWSRGTLSRASGVSVDTIKNFEHGTNPLDRAGDYSGVRGAGAGICRGWRSEAPPMHGVRPAAECEGRLADRRSDKRRRRAASIRVPCQNQSLQKDQPPPFRSGGFPAHIATSSSLRGCRTAILLYNWGRHGPNGTGGAVYYRGEAARMLELVIKHSSTGATYWLRVSSVAGLASVTDQEKALGLPGRLDDFESEAGIYRSAGVWNHGAICAVTIRHRMSGRR